MRTILGIFRAACYSPGMVERDEAILRAVAVRLERVGCVVDFIHEEDLTSDVPKPDVVIHMARSLHALSILQGWQEAGCRVINSVEGVRGVERAALAEACAAQGIPTPKTWIVDTADSGVLSGCTTNGGCDDIFFPCWVKRAGSCAQEQDDVCRVEDAEEYLQCLSRFHARGICKAVVMEHLDGPCFKFYAVPAAGFFYSLPSTSLGYDKFSNNPSGSIGGEDMWTGKMLDNLLPTIDLHLGVYGGDAIIGPDGVARLIDLNDWPSFSACREEAADAIVRLVMSIKN